MALLLAQEKGLQNIANYEGWGISITGISIVFVALILISLFITSLPRILALLESVLPPEAEHHSPPAAKPAELDDGVVAAIGFALHMRQHKKK